MKLIFAFILLHMSGFIVGESLNSDDILNLPAMDWTSEGGVVHTSGMGQGHIEPGLVRHLRQTIADLVSRGEARATVCQVTEKHLFLGLSFKSGDGETAGMWPISIEFPGGVLGADNSREQIAELIERHATGVPVNEAMSLIEQGLSRGYVGAWRREGCYIHLPPVIKPVSPEQKLLPVELQIPWTFNTEEAAREFIYLLGRLSREHRAYIRLLGADL